MGIGPRPSASPPPYTPQTIASFSLTALQADLGYVYTLTRSRPMAVRAPSREFGIPFAPDIYESIIILGILVGFTDAQQEGEVLIRTRRLFCDGPHRFPVLRLGSR